MEHTYSVAPDNRNRIALGDLAKGVSRFDVIFNKDDDTITLKPYVDIRRNELWLLQNKPSLASVRKGMADIISGDIGSLPVEIQKDFDSELKKLIDSNEL